MSGATYTFTVVFKVKADKPLTRDRKRAIVRLYKEEFASYAECGVKDTFFDCDSLADVAITSVTIV